MEDKNLTAIITTIRHGEKDQKGKLTAKGLEQAKHSGCKSEHIDGDVLLFHSGVERVRETLLEFGKYLHLNERDIEEEIVEEGHLQDYTSALLHYLHDKNNKRKYFSNWDNIEHTSEQIDARIVRYLEMRNSLEPEIFPSPDGLYKRLKKVITTQISFASLTKSSYRTNFINGTHEPNIMAFLFHALRKEDESAKDFVYRIGGSIKYAEGFQLRVYQKGEDIESILQFRDIEKLFIIK